MRILCWNVNGYRSAFGKGLPEFIAQQRPDIVCLQEMKADEKVLSEDRYRLSGYRGYHSVAMKKGYSGVSTFVREGFPQPKSGQFGIGVDHFDHEGRFAITNHADFDLYNIYYPSGTSGELRQAFKYKFLESLYEHVKNLSEKERNRVIMCGDFNICQHEIDIHHPDTATKLELTGFLPEERAWMNRFQELGFTDTFRHIHGAKPHMYSWWSFRANARAKNLGWRIDYIWVANTLAAKVRDAALFMQQKGSDHCPLTLDIDVKG